MLVDDGMTSPDDKTLDAFVHQVVDDWRACTLKHDMRLLLEWTEKLTRSPAEMTQGDVDSLRDAGWSDVAVHDAVQVVAYFNYINRVADALGVETESDLPHWGRGSE